MRHVARNCTPLSQSVLRGQADILISLRCMSEWDFPNHQTISVRLHVTPIKPHLSALMKLLACIKCQGFPRRWHYSFVLTYHQNDQGAPRENPSIIKKPFSHLQQNHNNNHRRRSQRSGQISPYSPWRSGARQFNFFASSPLFNNPSLSPAPAWCLQ